MGRRSGSGASGRNQIRCRPEAAYLAIVCVYFCMPAQIVTTTGSPPRAAGSEARAGRLYIGIPWPLALGKHAGLLSVIGQIGRLRGMP